MSKLFWYWPFARGEELDLAIAAARGDDELVIQTLDREYAPPAGRHGNVTVQRDLHDVQRGRMSKPVWMASRARTYADRARTRQKAIRSGRFDLVHLHFLNRFTDLVAPLPHPLVISVHDVLPHNPRLGVRGEKALHSRLYARADLLVVHHRQLADDLMNVFDIPSRRIGVVPMQVFPVADVKPHPPAGPPMFLLFGALRPNKGMDIVEAALRLLPDLDLRVVIAGQGDTELATRARRMAEEDPRVTAEIGVVSIERKHELFSDASVVLLPYTHFASQSAVLHDAYGHRRPVIATDVGALGVSVRDDGTGVVIAPRDPAALANAMRVTLDADNWSTWADACHAATEQRSPEVLGRKLRDAYDELL